MMKSCGCVGRTDIFANIECILIKCVHKRERERERLLAGGLKGGFVCVC